MKGCTATSHSPKSHSTIQWQRNNPERYNELRLETRARRLEEMQADPLDATHGTQTGYVYGCRCERCTAAQSNYSARYVTGKRYRVHKRRFPGGPSRALAPTFHTIEDATAFIAQRPFPSELYSIEDTQSEAVAS